MGLKINYFRKKLLNFFKSKEKILLLNSVTKLNLIYKYKKINSIIFLSYAPEVNEFLYWCQQLIAESLGKKGRGILPVVSPAPKDHHSLLQLYLDGPKDKLFYIFSLKANKEMKINTNIFGKNINYMNNKNFSKVSETACPWLMPNIELKGYETAWGAVVLDMLMALPARFDDINILFEFSKLGFLTNGK